MSTEVNLFEVAGARDESGHVRLVLIVLGWLIGLSLSLKSTAQKLVQVRLVVGSVFGSLMNDFK
jgi:hypothetical protein